MAKLSAFRADSIVLQGFYKRVGGSEDWESLNGAISSQSMFNDAHDVVQQVDSLQLFVLFIGTSQHQHIQP